MREARVTITNNIMSIMLLTLKRKRRQLTAILPKRRRQLKAIMLLMLKRERRQLIAIMLLMPKKEAAKSHYASHAEDKEAAKEYHSSHIAERYITLPKNHRDHNRPVANVKHPKLHKKFVNSQQINAQ